jgi:outer membrane receptor for ferrienterochelin and colicin
MSLLPWIGLFGQAVSGRVWERDENGTRQPVPFANVYWLGTHSGVTADTSGRFELMRIKDGEATLVVSFVGYQADTIHIAWDQRRVEVVMYRSRLLPEVEVKARNTGTIISTLNPASTQMISAEGMQRLACCSLADCFTNNATVDVGFSDAVSGARQIQMLGLAGVYSQILIENQPSMRLLATTYGLSFIPGPWLNAISISKGASSVINGFESITGQINIDLKKPESGETFYLELFTNDYLRIEANTNASVKLGKTLSTILLFNVSSTFRRIDRNGDGFMDVPLSTLITGSNRYFFNRKGKIRSRFGFDLLWEDRTGGQMNFDKETDRGTTNSYGITLTTKRIHIFENTGFAVDPESNSSIGINADFIWHDQQSMFGLTRYDAIQKSAYLNALFISDVRNVRHKITAGMSFRYDYLGELLKDSSMLREELVAGIFGEYTFNDQKKWILLAGVRGDWDNLYGLMFNPRMHARYSPWKNTTFRLSAGSGMRTANVIPEHIGLLASSRRFVFQETLDLERAWNYGIGFVQKFPCGKTRKGTVSVDFFRTDFQNQVVVDVDRDPEAVFFYNLKGPSYSNSFQAELIIEPVKMFEITLAYRLNDARITIDNKLTELPLTPKHRGLLALHYATRFDRWQFSFTTQYFGPTRLPDTKQNPVQYQLPSISPGYVLLYAQITFRFSRFETYLGCENITNYKQSNPILAADDPFGKYFDTSIVYAPILGRQFNFGIRFKIS